MYVAVIVVGLKETFVSLHVDLYFQLLANSAASFYKTKLFTIMLMALLFFNYLK